MAKHYTFSCLEFLVQGKIEKSLRLFKQFFLEVGRYFVTSNLKESIMKALFFYVLHQLDLCSQVRAIEGWIIVSSSSREALA
jgi:hypothetical protein